MFYNLLRSLILPLKEIDKNIPTEGKIIDLGCGQGIIAKYLASKKSRQVIAVDSDKNRLKKTTLQNLKFINADIRNFSLKGAKGIVISDVLHHLNPADQKKLLRNIYLGLSKYSVLVIKEIDNNEFFRSKFSRFWDFLFYPNDKIYYFKSNELKNYLEKLGFRVKIFRTTRFFPGSTTLFACKK